MCCQYYCVASTLWKNGQKAFTLPEHRRTAASLLLLLLPVLCCTVLLLLLLRAKTHCERLVCLYLLLYACRALQCVVLPNVSVCLHSAVLLADEDSWLRQSHLIRWTVNTCCIRYIFTVCTALFHRFFFNFCDLLNFFSRKICPLFLKKCALLKLEIIVIKFENFHAFPMQFPVAIDDSNLVCVYLTALQCKMMSDLKVYTVNRTERPS